ncbi:Uncharacterised protein [Kingella kingae]|nr:Uncharacterised protein [Kingella kingae]
MNTQQKLLSLYAKMAQMAFVEIRNLAFGRGTLHMEKATLPESVPTEKLLANFLVIGQLAEAMHNLPINVHDDHYSQYLTLQYMGFFLEKNPKYQRDYQYLIERCLQLNHQALVEIDADFVATIERKGLHEHK